LKIVPNNHSLIVNPQILNPSINTMKNIATISKTNKA